MQINNIGMSSAAGVYQSIVGFVLVFTAKYDSSQKMGQRQFSVLGRS